MNKNCIIKIIILCLVTFNVSAENKIVLFGDSLMAGYGLQVEYHLSRVLENSLASKGFKVKVVNASVSGDTSAGGLNRINWTLSEEDIDILILGLGANDMLRGVQPKETEKNLNKIIKLALDKKINVILAGMIAPNSYGRNYKKKFDKLYKSLSDKYNLSFIPFLLEGVALKSEFNLQDGMHPNEKGVKIISKTIEKKIIKLLN